METNMIGGIRIDLNCEHCNEVTNIRYKDPKSEEWLCFQCDRAFKAKMYGDSIFKQALTFLFLVVAKAFWFTSR